MPKVNIASDEAIQVEVWKQTPLGAVLEKVINLSNGSAVFATCEVRPDRFITIRSPNGPLVNQQKS